MAEKGKVKFYNWKKGFGFVTTDSGEDLFLHRTGIPKGVKLYTEDEVEFDVIEGPKGKNATNIKVLSSKGPQRREEGEQHVHKHIHKKTEETDEEIDEEATDSEDFGADDEN